MNSEKANESEANVDVVEVPSTTKETKSLAEKPETLPQNQETVLSVGKILWFFLLMALPVVNIIIAIKWSLNQKINKNLRNLARAMLIVFVFTLILYSYLLFAK